MEVCGIDIGGIMFLECEWNEVDDDGSYCWWSYDIWSGGWVDVVFCK